MAQTTNILWVAPNYNDHGGLERYNHEVVEALIGTNATVHVVTTFECTRPDGPGFSSTTLDPTWWPARKVYGKIWPRVLDLHLRSYQAPLDLVIAGHVYCLPAALRLARKRGVPCWVLAFGIEVWGTIKPEYARCLCEADRVITISEFTKKMIRASSGRTTAIDIVAPTTDTQVFRPQPVKRSDTSTRLLTVGRLAGGERYKGHDIVMEALRHLREKKIDNIEYWIAGDGEDRARLEYQAKVLNVGDGVRFLGRVSDAELPALYNECDIFIMPSFVQERQPGIWTGEGFGIVYIEASACEKPVIGCDVGGQTDCILHEKTGLHIKPTAEAAAEAIEYLITHREKAHEMGVAGRQFVQQHFSPELFRERWKSLLKQDVS